MNVPTLFRGRFRKAQGGSSLRRYVGTSAPATAVLREELLAVPRQPETLLRFLAEMDRKLDAILAHLQRESLAEEFPCEGHIVELSGTGLVLECSQAFVPGDSLELLLMLEEYPMRVIPLLAGVEEKRSTPAVTGPGASVYALAFLSVEEEDREAIIRFVFSEERKRIRQRKGEGL